MTLNGPHPEDAARFFPLFGFFGSKQNAAILKQITANPRFVRIFASFSRECGRELRAEIRPEPERT
jgi:hypothetical protein